jgi:hypothetical protein
MPEDALYDEVKGGTPLSALYGGVYDLTMARSWKGDTPKSRCSLGSSSCMNPKTIVPFSCGKGGSAEGSLGTKTRWYASLVEFGSGWLRYAPCDDGRVARSECISSPGRGDGGGVDDTFFGLNRQSTGDCHCGEKEC